MKKSGILYKIAIVVFCVLLSLSGCTKKPDTSDDGISATETSTYLFYKGMSDYVVVIPKDATQREKFAASELNYFFKLSTGYEFDVITDEKIQPSFIGGKYISLGKTVLLYASDVKADYETLGKSGYVLDTIGNTLFISGTSGSSSGYGTIYGVYAFLNYVINYKCYADTEIQYDKKTSIKLYKFDNYIDVPDIQTRSLGFMKSNLDATYTSRLRMTVTGTGGDWVLFGHSNTTILPTSVYYDEHPDWFVQNDKNSQLCWTNDEMTEQFILNVETFLSRDKTSEYIHLGQADSQFPLCECSKCKAKALECGGASGVQIAFANKVARAVNKWVEENQPGRVINYVIYAYNGTVAPPVKYDEKTNDYVPACDEVIPEKNVYVMYTIIGMDFGESILSGNNSSYGQNLKNWNKVCKDNNLLIYGYTINYNAYFTLFDNFDSTQETYRAYAENGVSYVYDQGPANANTPAFQEMRLYCQSQMLWDTSKTYEELIDEFMPAYYKDAAPSIREYFNAMRTWFKILESTTGDTTISGNMFYSLYNPQLWPNKVLLQFNKIFDKALASIEHFKKDDPELYQKLWDRIKIEQLTPYYLILTNYRSSYSSSEIARMQAEFLDITDRYQYTNISEGGSLIDVTQGWSNNSL